MSFSDVRSQCTLEWWNYRRENEGVEKNDILEQNRFEFWIRDGGEWFHDDYSLNDNTGVFIRIASPEGCELDPLGSTENDNTESSTEDSSDSSLDEDTSQEQEVAVIEDAGVEFSSEELAAVAGVPRETVDAEDFDSFSGNIGGLISEIRFEAIANGWNRDVYSCPTEEPSEVVNCEIDGIKYEITDNRFIVSERTPQPTCFTSQASGRWNAPMYGSLESNVEDRVPRVQYDYQDYDYESNCPSWTEGVFDSDLLEKVLKVGGDLTDPIPRWVFWDEADISTEESPAKYCPSREDTDQDRDNDAEDACQCRADSDGDSGLEIVEESRCEIK